MDPATGGPCQGIRNSIPCLSELGVESEVVCLDRGSETTGDPFPVHSLGRGNTAWGYQARLPVWLNANLGRFDAVISHGLWQFPGVASRRAAMRARKPYFVFPHGMLDPWFQRHPTRRWKAVRNWWYWKLVETRVIRDAAGVLFTCQEELHLARKSFRPYRPRQEIVVGYGVPEPPAATEEMHREFRRRCPELGSERYLLFLGRIHPKKGTDLLLKAYGLVGQEHRKSGLPMPHLVIAGPGADRGYGRKLRQAANKVTTPAGKPRIHFPGLLRGPSKWGAFYGADAFVLPSHQENFGIAVVEALACGTPVLLSDQVNIWREVVQDGVGIAAPDTLDGIMSLLQQLDQVTLTKGSPSTKACFENRFSNRSAATDLLKAITRNVTGRSALVASARGPST